MLTADKRRVRCIVDGHLFMNFKEALRYLGLEDEFTSNQRTDMRKMLKGGKIIHLRGSFIVPIMGSYWRMSL